LCRIPLSFILGFYVSQVISRWWDQWRAIAWPDRTVNIHTLYQNFIFFLIRPAD
jgi:hypothetical protein